MSGEARDFNNMETRDVIKFSLPPPARQGTEEIHAILKQTLGEHAPSYAIVKTWVTHFKRGDFSTWATHPPPRRLLIKFTIYSWKTAGFWLNQ